MSADAFAIALQHQKAGRIAQAEELCRRLLQRQPGHAAALHLLGRLCHQDGRHGEAVDLLSRSVQLAPDAADFRANFAAALGSLGRHADAAEQLRQAVRVRPGHPRAHHNLGVALEAVGDLAAAEAALREAVRLDPSYALAHHHLGNVVRRRGRLVEAAECYRRAIALRPGHAEAHNNLGTVLQQLGRVGEAIECFREASRLDPACRPALSNDLVCRRYAGDDPRELRALFEDHVAWARRHAAPLYATIKPHDNDRDPKRRLRVGYLSPDFKRHPVARFIEPILSGHDRGAVEVFCYADVRPRERDAVTRRLAGVADAWRDVSELSDESAADLIRADRVDVLVDLAGQTDGRQRQLMVLARQPAPVQAAYLGYSDTTGLATVGYRVTDGFCDPPGLGTDAYYTEELVRLPGCAWCYRPFDAAPEVNELPAPAAGHVTFAAFNRLAKVTPRTVGLWAAVMRRVPGSRLLAVCEPGGEADARGLLQGRLQAAGVDGSRLDLVPRQGSARAYLLLYHRVDLALDSFPHNGHTTTCDALWMGVPTVTLAGRSFIGRLGASVLSAVGLARELVAESDGQFVDLAAALASDLPKLAARRGSLRQRFADSPLADGPGLARRLEAAYRAMWRRWC